MASWKFFLNNIEVEEPIGWDGVEFTAKRTEEHGVDQPFSTEVSFYGRGAKLIKSLYDTQFINAEITIKIVSDVWVNGSPWEFNGYINMALYSELNVCDTDSWQVSVGIIDDNFREKFKSRMDVDVDIYASVDLDGNPISSPITDYIRLHTQEVYLVGYAQSFEQKYPISTWATIFWMYSTGWKKYDFAAVIPAYKTNTDFQGPFGAQFDPVQVKFSGTNVIFKNNSNFTRTISFDVTTDGAWRMNNGNSGDTTNLALIIGYGSNVGNNGQNLNEVAGDQTSTFAFPTGIKPFSLSASATITLVPGAVVLIYYQFGNGGNVYPGATLSGEIGRSIEIWVDDVCVSITEKNGAEYASFTEALVVENFFKRLVKIITGNSNGFVSDAFSRNNNGCYWNYALTNGLKIRQAKTTIGSGNTCDPLVSSPQTNFKVSFKQLFDNLSSIFCLGWAFEYVNNSWKVRVEPIEYFYQNNIEFTALNVGEVRQSAKVEDLANQFKIGYDDTWKNIQAAGLWAIHTDRNYYVDNRAMAEGTTKKVELLSGIIAEGYAIEFSRRMYFFQDDSGSSDRPNDYELFIIWLNRTSLGISNIENSEYRLPPSYNENGYVVIAEGTASMSSNRITQSNSEVGALYNIAITPTRNAYRWWKVVGMHTYGLAQPKLRFQTGQYQLQYSSIIDISQEPCQEFEFGQLIVENSDVDPNLMNNENKAYLFKPIQIEFEYPQSFCDFINLADNHPYGRIRLKSGSLDVSGWIETIANKPEDDSGGTTSFTIIASNLQNVEPVGERAYSGAYSNAYL